MTKPHAALGTLSIHLWGDPAALVQMRQTDEVNAVRLGDPEHSVQVFAESLEQLEGLFVAAANAVHLERKRRRDAAQERLDGVDAA